MPGEAVGIVGESGCGKSTVAFAIMHYLGTNGRIVGGSIHFEGRDMTSMSEDELRSLRGSEIAMVYQEPMASLNPSMTVGDQLTEVPITHEGVAQRGGAWTGRGRCSASVRLPDPARIMESYPHQISGGQQQRVVIAMALLSNPSLLLLDEPTTALDVTVEAGIVELIKDIAAEFGTSMIYISHNLGLILETCDRITVMYSGEAVEVGRVKDVFDAMRHPYTRGLFASIPLPGADKNARPLVADPGPAAAAASSGRPAAISARAATISSPDAATSARFPMVVVEGASFQPRAACASSEIDWDAAPVAEAAGASRPARATWCSGRRPHQILRDREERRLLCRQDADGEGQRAARLRRARGGDRRHRRRIGLRQVHLRQGADGAGDGDRGRRQARQSRSAKRRSRSGAAQTIAGYLQMVFQNPFDTLNPSHTVGGADRPRHPQVRRREGRGQGAGARASSCSTWSSCRASSPSAGRASSPAGRSSASGIARAFAGNPKVVIADEPVSALDVSVQAAVTELLMDIQRDHRTTLLFISHDLSVVRYLADRVVVMYLGQIIEQGTTAEVFSPPYHPYTEALLSAVPIADTSI